jgi:hypothetical protein
MRYSIQFIDSKTDGPNYRITDNNSDSRVATCYVKENAEMVCEALNMVSKANALESAAKDFIKKVDEGRARSTDSYNKFKKALKS